MRICIFGAGGDTGRELVRQGMDRRYEVTAFVREGGEDALDSTKVRLITGDAMVYDDVKAAVTDVHAVLSALGHGLDTPRGMHEQAIDNIIHAMETENVTRLVSLTGSGVRHPDDNPPMLDVILNRMFALTAPWILADGRAHARRIWRSNLDWTIARAGKLTKAAANGAYYSSETMDKTSPLRIPRADMARFMLDQITEENYRQKMPYVSAASPGR
jgi:putative NADH-flavin reductase